MCGICVILLPTPSETISAEVRLQKFVNLVVAILSWLALGKPTCAPLAVRAGVALSAGQQDTVMRFRKLSTPWQKVGTEEFPALGRAAAKYTHITASISSLQGMAFKLFKILDDYAPSAAPHPESVLHAGFRARDHGTCVVGFLDKSSFEAATDVDATKLNFKSSPSFDPIPYYNEELAKCYLQ